MVAAGDVIGNRYTVLSPLGTGGQGEVYRVLDATEGDEVALKILNPSSTTPLGPWAEAQILRRLTDNHILPIRNAQAFVGFPVLVTDVAEHGTVEDRIAAAPLGVDVEDAIRWIQQACQGITRGHDLGLVHNDIKPGNLFLTARNDCRVGDFGYAGKLDPATRTSPVYGATPATAAPEVAAAWPAASATVASDVYSLGATAFHMLAGEPPHDFTGIPDPMAKMNHVATTPSRKLRDVAPHVPDSVARVIDRALSVDPVARPSTPHAFGAQLGRGISGRRWQRTNEHATHLGCWRGKPFGGGSEFVLCVTVGAKPTQLVVETRHASSGNRVPNGAHTGPARAWSALVRKVMRAVG